MARLDDGRIIMCVLRYINNAYDLDNPIYINIKEGLESVAIDLEEEVTLLQGILSTEQASQEMVLQTLGKDDGS